MLNNVIINFVIKMITKTFIVDSAIKNKIDVVLSTHTEVEPSAVGALLWLKCMRILHPFNRKALFL